MNPRRRPRPAPLSSDLQSVPLTALPPHNTHSHEPRPAPPRPFPGTPRALVGTRGGARARAGWGAGWAGRHPRPPVSPLPRVSSGRAGTQLCPAQPAARESSALSQLCGGRLAVCSPDLVQSTPAWVRIHTVDQWGQGQPGLV